MNILIRSMLILEINIIVTLFLKHLNNNLYSKLNLPQTNFNRKFQKNNLILSTKF